MRLGVLIGSNKFSIVDGVGSGLVDLDEVRAFFKLLAHHRNQFVGIIGVVCVGQNALRRVVTDRVFVSAKDVDRVPANAETRARNLSVSTGI